jgi:serine/threonine protein kinase
VALTAGTHLGPYEVTAQIGVGGMGEVYRARDTRLNRTVAIKALPAHLRDNADLRQRFEREAQAVAALNHPHICTLHDIGHHEGVDFLVMEYLEGETLADRLARKAGSEDPVLSSQEVLRYAIEIAKALDHAHRKGITHRDLKPSNIMVTTAGAKVLDFGLAKLRARPVVQGFSPAFQSAAPTEEASLTAVGTILGTLQYMAPEQLEGKEADARKGRHMAKNRRARA